MKGLGDVDKTTLRDRRRFVVRRVRARLLAFRYLIIALAIVVVGGLGLWTVKFHGLGGLLDVQKVNIVGANTRTTPAMIEQAAHLPVGSSMASANLGAIESNVLHDASLQQAVLSADVSREWPDTIKIVITLRTPVAAVSFGDHCEALDATGSLFLHYPTSGSGCAKPLDVLPLVQSPSAAANSQQAYLQAAGVAGQMPVSLRSLVKYISIASEDGVTLVLKGDGARKVNDGTVVAWGNAANTALKAQELSSLMKANPGARAYNVSVPASPTVTP